MKKEKISGIYEIINEKNGRVYIGSSGNIEQRFKTHQADLKAGRHCNKDLQRDYNNGENLRYEIIKNLPVDLKEELMTNEAREINKAKREGKKLYNIDTVYEEHYISEYTLKNKIVNLYCKEHFGKNYYALTNGAAAKRSLLYELLDAKTEEEKKKIQDKYKDTIKYQNKIISYGNLFDLNYENIKDLPEEEKKEEIRRAKERKNWKQPKHSTK